jgi:hypothetical protein
MNKNPLQDILNRSRQHRKENSKIDNPAWVNRTLGVREAYKNPELRKKHSELRKGKSISKEHAEHIRNARLAAPPRTEKTKKKISEKQLGNGKHNKAIMTTSGAFISKTEAAKWAASIGLSNPIGRLDKLLKTQPDQFYFISKEQYEQTKDYSKDINQDWLKGGDNKKKPVFTPNGIFESASQACKYFDKSLGWLKDKMKRLPNEYFYIT